MPTWSTTFNNRRHKTSYGISGLKSISAGSSTVVRVTSIFLNPVLLVEKTRKLIKEGDVGGNAGEDQEEEAMLVRETPGTNSVSADAQDLRRTHDLAASGI